MPHGGIAGSVEVGAGEVVPAAGGGADQLAGAVGERRAAVRAGADRLERFASLAVAIVVPAGLVRAGGVILGAHGSSISRRHLTAKPRRAPSLRRTLRRLIAEKVATQELPLRDAQATAGGPAASQ